jgi:uncharacterized protein YukE
MASDNYGQLTTILQRLGDALSLLNPITLVQTVISVLREISTPPPGDPGELRNLAAAFRSAAGQVEPVAEDIRALGSRRLPEVWHGMAATSATQVVTATAAVVGATPDAFRQAGAALDALAEQIQDQHRRHGELHQALYDAYQDATHVGGFAHTRPVRPGRPGRGSGERDTRLHRRLHRGDHLGGHRDRGVR